jgi:uncharacterized membrane protein (UPF0136 family)
MNLYSALSAISAVSSRLVVVTGLLTFSRSFSSSRPFSHSIFFVSLSDCLASLGGIMGYPQNNSWTCPVQSFLFLMFFPATWIWSSLLVYQLRNLIINKSINLSLFSMHTIGLDF